MAETPSASPPEGSVVISIDALGGEGGTVAVVDGMAKSARKNPDIFFIVHGNKPELTPHIAKLPELAARTEIRHVTKAVEMTEKPSRALRTGKDSSMWNALETVKNGEATVAVSCGNTGALMVMSTLVLRKLPGVDRPAIAVLWPSRNPSGYNVVLDVGADIKAEAVDLLKYAVMGASYARNGLDLASPRIGLLNVGTEEHKGRTALHEAAELMQASAATHGFEFVGYVEGTDISGDRVDIIVTDGFTGNIALKTAEGTASLIRDFLKGAFNHSFFSRVGALFAMTSLTRLSKRIDPRRVNGGVFLGLNGTVVKSHGSADATGFSAAIKLAFILAQRGFTKKLAARVATQPPLSQSGGPNNEAEAS